MSTEQPRANITESLTKFGDELRQEGLAVGTSELIDAFAALQQIDWHERHTFREALATTIAKSQQDRTLFNSVFDRFFFYQAEVEALALAEESGRSVSPDSRIDLAALKQQALEAIAAGDDSSMLDIAQLAIAAFSAQGQSSGVTGVDVQRIRRMLTQPEPSDQPGSQPAPGHGLPLNNLRRFEGYLRRELQRGTIERSGQLPPKQALSEMGRALPSGQLEDLSEIHRVVAQLKKRLATSGQQQAGRKRNTQIDLRHTLRASLQTGGVPVDLKFKPHKPRRPELYVLCDVSTSVSSASVFFLSVMHALHDSFRKLRSFVFIEQAAEVTAIFEDERDIKLANQRINKEAGVADRSGYTDYGRVWTSFYEQIKDDLNPKSTLIVLGDARTNGRDPGTDIFETVAAKAGRTYWLNPEPYLYWNYGDSVIAEYEKICPIHECCNPEQLADFVKILTSDTRQ